MRLLETSTLKLREFSDDELPDYAILSHRWGETETTFQHVERGILDQKSEVPGVAKVQRLVEVARRDNYSYVWLDTCCIDKTSSAELSEAINSMFHWYFRAKKCYAYLFDVPPAGAIQQSQWFLRGWTLQELLAPSIVEFLDANWESLGTKSKLQDEISRITNIPISILSGDVDLDSMSIAQRMSWAATRKTTRIEDSAYCLMGLFGIYMPLIYGEGERAFMRLQEEIMKVSDDHSLFAWEHDESDGGLLATNPAAFKWGGNIVQHIPLSISDNAPILSSRGVHLEVPFLGIDRRGIGVAVLNCREQSSAEEPIGIYLRDVSLTLERFERVNTGKRAELDPWIIRRNQCQMRKLCVPTRRMLPTRKIRQFAEDNFTIYNDDHYKGMLRRVRDYVVPSALSDAAAAGHEGRVWMLLTRRDVMVDWKDHLGRTALSYAVENGHTAVVKMLLPRSDIALTDYNDRAALSWAAAGGHMAIVKLCLDAGASIQEQDRDGRTPLFWAIEHNHQTVAKRLIKRGAVVYNSSEKSHGAAPQPHEMKGDDMAEVLDISGAPVETRFAFNSRSLLEASIHGWEAGVRFFLGLGAHTEVTDEHGQTPLFWAVFNRYDRIARLLITYQAEVYVTNNSGETLISVATEKGFPNLLELLIGDSQEVVQEMVADTL